MPDGVPPIVNIKLMGPAAYVVGDTLRLEASLANATGVGKIEIHVDGRIVKTCTGLSCEYSEALTTPGLHRCWAIAKDEAGNVGRSNTLEFLVHPAERRGPWLDVRVQPYSPTSRDMVKFMVKGSAPGGIERIILYINNREVAASDKETFEYVGGPYPPGNLAYRILARSRGGEKDYGQDGVIEVAPQK